MQTDSCRERLILAVDTASKDEAQRMLEELHPFVGVFKIGLQLFTQYGPEILNIFLEAKRKVFLDCKFLDIPNTVAKASESATALGVFMFTVHASGGKTMLKACAEATAHKAKLLNIPEPLILGVTVLTSMPEETLRQELRVSCAVQEQVVNLAELSWQSGIKGIVASPAEVTALREQLGSEAIIVTPGVRPSWAGTDDQSRIMTPAQAIASGSNYLVVGRPITNAKKPAEAAARILEEMQTAFEK